MYIIGERDILSEIGWLIRRHSDRNQNITIFGGSRIGLLVAKLLENNKKNGFNLKLIDKNIDKCKEISALVVFCIIIVTASLRIFHYNDLFLALRKAAFQVISIITTTGFTTDNFDAWSPLAKGILFSLMFIGGCGGSTAGAIKQIRILILIKHSFREIYKMIHPKAVIPLRVGNKVVTEEIVTNILGFMFLYLTIFVIASLTLASMGIDLISSLTAVAATLGNVGPGLGMVGPLNTYSPIPDLGKILLTLMMLIGRLEIYTVLVLLLPDYRRYRYRKGFKLF